MFSFFAYYDETIIFMGKKRKVCKKRKGEVYGRRFQNY